jgi:hypothetical protein
MTVYCYSLPLRAMEETLGRDDRSGPRRQGSPRDRDADCQERGDRWPYPAEARRRDCGETSFIALDGAGTPLAQSLIRVAENALLVQRGLDRTTRKRPACNRVLPKRASYCNVLQAVGFGAAPKVAAKNPSTAPIDVRHRWLHFDFHSIDGVG